MKAFGNWLTAHPGNLLIFLMVVFAVGNLVFQPKSPAQWKALSARNPRLAGLFDVLAGLWPNAVKIWAGLRVIVLGRAVTAAGGDPVLLEVVQEVEKTTTTATATIPREEP